MNALKNKPAIIIGIVSVFYLIAGFNFEINIYDEAIGIVGAERILNGELPYQDFWTIYSPGIFYFNAILISIISDDIFSLRLVNLCMIIFMAVLSYKLNIRSMNKKLALIPFVILIVWSNFGSLYFRSLLPALLLTFLCMYLLYNYIQDANKKWLWLSGITMACIGLFRHDMGGYLFGTFFQVVFWSSLSHKEIQGKKIFKKIIYGIKEALYFAYGTALIAIPIGAVIFFSIPFDQLYNQLIEIPLNVFRDYRSLPFPDPFVIFSNSVSRNPLILLWEGMIFYLPITIYIITIITIIYRIKKKTLKLGGLQFWFEMLIFNVGINLYNHAIVRSDIEHLYPTLIFSTILMVNLIGLIRSSYIKNGLLILSLSFILVVPITKKIQKLKLFTSNDTIEMPSKRANLIYADKSFVMKYSEILNFIQENIPDDEKIFIGCREHDRVLLNHVMLYYLSERMPAVKYHELHPGVTTRKEVQEEIVRSLKSINYIILVNENEYESSNLSSVSSNVFVLDKYIDNNYEVVMELDEYQILKKL